MTELLKQAIAEIEKMPADVQDAIAARLLAELADEKAWQERFAMTTAEQWDRMAEIARQEIEAGIMRLIYDRETDTLALILQDTSVVESDEHEPGIILDYDASGHLVSLEILDASRRV